MRVLILGLAVMLGCGAAGAAPRGDTAARLAADMHRVLRMDELLPVLRDEALAEARVMQQEGMIPASEAGAWTQAVARIHDPARLRAMLEVALREALRGQPQARLDTALVFYRESLGSRVLTLETQARAAMIDPGTDRAARAAWARAVAAGDPRVGRIRRLIEEADLVEPNVASGMNAALAFSAGFVDAGGVAMPQTEAQMLSDIWRQEPQIRADTRDWLEAFLYLAYAQLSDAQLDRLIAHAGSAPGRVLSAVLFAGYDRVYAQTSREMGAAAARRPGTAL